MRGLCTVCPAGADIALLKTQLLYLPTHMIMAEHLPSKIPSELADTIIDYLHMMIRAPSS